MVVEVAPREEDQARTGLEPDPAIVEAVEEADAEASAEVMSLLHEGIPLTLLADLVSPEGPHSPEILEDEGLPETAWWEPDAVEGASSEGDDPTPVGGPAS